MRRKLLSILALLCLTVASAWADSFWTKIDMRKLRYACGGQTRHPQAFFVKGRNGMNDGVGVTFVTHPVLHL